MLSNSTSGIEKQTSQQAIAEGGPGDIPDLAKANPIYIGRQPIFDRQRNVYGYELLFRSSKANFYSHEDPAQATREAVNSGLNVVGLDRLVGGGLGFVNIPRTLLLDGFCELLPANRIVLELLESIEPDQEVVEACRVLKDLGYQLALDDFVFDKSYYSLLEIADYVKVDFKITNKAERHRLVKTYARPGLKFLAEKVESPKECEEAYRIGYDYFQGYFFQVPEVVEGRTLGENEQNCMLLLAEVNQPKLDFGRIEMVVKRDPSLSMKLLRYLNSAVFSLRNELHSIRQALTMLGERPLRKWASMIALTSMGSNKPRELLRVSLTRATFFEMLAMDIGMGDRQFDLFMMGMLSVLDALLDSPMESVIGDLPLAGDVKLTLLGVETELNRLQELLQHCEQGSWGEAVGIATQLEVHESRLIEVYYKSMKLADEMLKV